ncbi:zinc-binding dehydrogenase [Microbacterium hydrocarbonoxydans]|uniref:zinc-binding dehydrogenase n=1 Tax=Microbacterium hydrocarbonoxydans TaxID=273678 RepID=UPI00203F979D|nr:zinc-binding dehydrogenase [Microbacterium hydrocarbonoxydans]MCM3778695.1 zinc-binding dehydrogenase [Microbacterium hydrocarbonoxydans]
MRAWMKDSGAPGGLTLAEVPHPVPGSDELVVRVDAFAPNPGDLAALPGLPDGAIPGWDGSGVVVEPAADGNGPRVGERVVFLSLASAGWAEHRAVPHAMTARASTAISAEHLATLPVPATSALRGVRRLGSVLGRRVLIVGATGAVGRVAVQIAARSGAHVVAVARDADQHRDLRRLGASETHRTVESVRGRVHGALDTIGGEQLVAAYALLDAGGTVIALGHAAGADEVFPYGAFVADPSTANRSITSFFLGAEPDLVPDMTYLAADRDLDVGPLDVRSWTELGDWVSAGGPRSRGRVVFRVDQA